MRLASFVLRSSCLVFCVLWAGPAFAQRFTFERTFDVAASSSLDVVTERGAIDVRRGSPGRIVVRGTVTVRLGVNTPSNRLLKN